MELETVTAGEGSEIRQEHIALVQNGSNKWYSFLPDRRKIILTFTQSLVLLFLYASLYGILGRDALPGSEIFALLLLLVAAHIGGKLAAVVKLPSLVGMLIVGFLFRNLPFIHFYENVSIRWATTLRASALVIILLKAGLGLDSEKLKKLSLVVFQLAFAPCIVETIATAIASHFILGLPWPWALMLGFVVAAVSPAVIVPSLLSLQEKQFGVKKGIPTLVIASASVDDIIAITGFTVMLSISLSEGDLLITILKGVLEPVGGLVVGIVLGRTFWDLPSKQSPSSSLIYYHIMLLCLGGFASMFLSKTLDVAGAGPMACLVMAFVAALGWKKNPQHLESIEKITSVLWSLLQPFLFSLIGAEVSVNDLQSNLGNTILALSIGLVFRIVAASFATMGGNLNLKEKIFVAFAWLPKATVQAAVGPQALDLVLSKNSGQEMEEHAQKILTSAVLCIIMTAPIGAALIAILGPLLLSQDGRGSPKSEKNAEGHVQEGVSTVL